MVEGLHFKAGLDKTNQEKHDDNFKMQEKIQELLLEMRLDRQDKNCLQVSRIRNQDNSTYGKPSYNPSPCTNTKYATSSFHKDTIQDGDTTF